MQFKSVFVAAAIAALAGAANGAFFSFASDYDDTSWTFRGLGAGVQDADDPADPQLLYIDDDNGPLPSVSGPVEFEADFVLSQPLAIDLGDGTILYKYRVDGAFAFFVGNVALSATIQNGTLTALGIPGAWHTTATIQANDRPTGPNGPADVTYTAPGDVPGYGIYTGNSTGPDDAAFTLTALHSDLGLGVPLGTDLMPASAWFSEGSYSGMAHWIPAPSAAVSFVGLAGLAIRRRR